MYKKNIWHYFKIVVFVLVLFSLSFKLYNWYRGGEFSIIPKPILPKCDSKEVKKLVSDTVVIGAKLLKEDITFIDLKNIKEMGFSPEKEIRSCDTLVITAQGNEDFNFTIRWNKKRDKIILKPIMDNETEKYLKDEITDIFEELTDKEKEELRKDINKQK